MGEIIDITEKLTTRRRRAILEQPSTGVEAVLLATQTRSSLISAVERSLSTGGAKISFDERFLPELHFGFFETTTDKNYLSTAPSRTRNAIHVAVTPNYTLPATSKINAIMFTEQTIANALFMVSYGLVIEAIKNSYAIGQRRKADFNEQLWAQTEQDVHMTEVNAMRTAGYVTSRLFDVEPLHGFTHTQQDTVVPLHVAGLYNPLNRMQARAIFAPLAK